MDSGQNGPLTSTDISHLFNRNKPRTQLAAIKNDLLATGLVLHRQQGDGNRKTDVYELIEKGD